MKSVVALIQREYLEHRGAFLYAPMILLAIFAAVMILALGVDRFGPKGMAIGLGSIKMFELGYLVTSAAWFAYLLGALFFYFADAFNADRRNNAMLFWKSMPITDFKVLGSKMLAGLTVFPALIFVAMVVGLLIATGLSTIAVLRLPNPALPDFVALIGSASQILLFDIVFVLLGLLWYAPFFAWVGSLSTVVGRWSIPLAFLIPGMIGALENVLFDSGSGPRAGYVLNYLRRRAEFLPHDGALQAQVFSAQPFDAVKQIADLLVMIDWTQLIGGLAVTLLLVWLASEYRRRVVAT
jgi:ABC-2 type transport system permease protein